MEITHHNDEFTRHWPPVGKWAFIIVRGIYHIDGVWAHNYVLVYPFHSHAKWSNKQQLNCIYSSADLILAQLKETRQRLQIAGFWLWLWLWPWLSLHVCRIHGEVLISYLLLKTAYLAMGISSSSVMKLFSIDYPS